MLATTNVLRFKTGAKTIPSSNPRRQVGVKVFATTEEDSIIDRRSTLLISLGVFLGTGGVGKADAAKSDAYYAELKANAGINSSDLMSRYSSLSAEDKKTAKGATRARSKNVSKNAEVLGLKARTAKTASKPAIKSPARKVSSGSASVSAPALNPIEVGLGLLALAGVGVIGSKGSSRSTSSPKPAAMRRAPAPVRKAPAPVRKAPAPVRKAAPPATKKKAVAAAAGTQKLRPGTRPVQAAKTKRIGTVTKGAGDEKKSGAGGAAGAALGILALAGAAVVLGGGSPKDVKKTSLKDPAPVEKKAEANDSSNATAAVAPPVKADKTQALIVKVEEKKPETAKPAAAPTPKLPPTTGNSPAVLVGGSLVALVAAAAVGNPRNDGESSSTSSQPLPGGSAADDAAARAADARKWIDAWKAKQK